jgi:hypothetical protein
VLRFATWAAWLFRSPHEEQQYADELLSLSDEHGFPLWAGWAMDDWRTRGSELHAAWIRQRHDQAAGRFFAKLTRRRLKRGVFRSIVELQGHHQPFSPETNDNPKPFTWTADPDRIIAAVRRGHQVLGSSTRPLAVSWEFGT